MKPFRPVPGSREIAQAAKLRVTQNSFLQETQGLKYEHDEKV
jgi:hypothetical protein